MSKATRVLRRIGIPGLAAATTLLVPGAFVAATTSTAYAAAPTTTLSYIGSSTGVNITNAGGTTANLADVYSPVSDNDTNTPYYTEGSVTETDAAAGTTVTLTSTGAVVFGTTATGPYTATSETVTLTGGTADFYFADPTSQQATVLANSSVGGAAQGTANYDSLLWTNCAATDGGEQPVATPCSAVSTAGASQMLTAVYLADGTATAGVQITATDPDTGTLLGGAAGPITQTAVTNSTGDASFTFVSNDVGTLASPITAKPTADLPEPAGTPTFEDGYPTAALTETVLTSATPQRLINTSETLLTPGNPAGTGSYGAAAAQPGDVYAVTYGLVADCSNNIATGMNNCATPTGVSGAGPVYLPDTAMTLTAPTGWAFTTCKSANYDTCSFEGTGGTGTATTGSEVGFLTTTGSTDAVTTSATGTATVYLTVGKDANLDAYGFDFGAVTATTATATTPLPETLPGDSSTADTCLAVGSAGLTSAGAAYDGGLYTSLTTVAHTDVNTDYAGCPTDQLVQSITTPLNEGTPTLSVVPASDTNGTFTVTGSSTLPDTTASTGGGATGGPGPVTTGTVTANTNGGVFAVTLTDQFGNDVQNGGKLTVTSSDGGGGLYTCYAPPTSTTAPLLTTAATSSDACIQGGTPVTAVPSTGSSATPYTQSGTAYGSFTDATNPWGMPAQADLLATSFNPEQDAILDGTQTVTVADSAAPVTTFANTALSAVTTATQALTVAPFSVTWYNQTAQSIVTFKVGPANVVDIGKTITVSATVVDQNANPIEGDAVHFTLAGPGYNSQVCSFGAATATTDTAGTAGDTIQCSANSTITVNVTVTDASGNLVSSGTYTIGFDAVPSLTATASLKKAGTAVLIGHARPGASVKLYAKSAGGSFVLVRTKDTNPSTGRIIWDRRISKTTDWKITVDGLRTSSTVTTKVK